MPLPGTRPFLALVVVLSLILPLWPARADDAQRLARLEALVAAQEARIRTLEAELASGGPLARAYVPAQDTSASELRPPPLVLSGDLRLRAEHSSAAHARARDRLALRARLRATYALNGWLTAGGQLTTGDPDDPNSTDATLSGFADDFPVSLDQTYLRAQRGGLEAYAGKFPLPFARTDLVWDGDVSPRGASLGYTATLGREARVRTSALYFAVNESVAGPDSRMLGGQIVAEASRHDIWQAEGAIGYYDCRLASLAGAGAGDLRSNLLRADGGYASDFDLLDLLAAATYSGFGERWPVRVAADYVQNLGASTSADRGYAVDLTLGRTRTAGDWRLGYGYARTEADAVLAAFSQDNTTLATNYVQHGLLLDYVPAAGILLNATLYRYRPLRGADRHWLDRLRLQMMVSF